MDEWMESVGLKLMGTLNSLTVRVRLLKSFSPIITVVVLHIQVKGTRTKKLDTCVNILLALSLLFHRFAEGIAKCQYSCEELKSKAISFDLNISQNVLCKAASSGDRAISS
jgi:hypothetical protein